MDKNNDSINVEKNNTIYVTDKDFEPMGVAQDWDIEEPSQSKKPKSRRNTLAIVLVTVVVTVFVTVAVLVTTVLATLNSDKTDDSNTKATKQVIQTSAKKDTVQQVEKKTEAPTKAPTKAPKKVEENTFEPYLVTLYPPTYVFADSQGRGECVLAINEKGVYTIVAEQYNPYTNSNWGKLKSGVGWINLAYANKPAQGYPGDEYFEKQEEDVEVEEEVYEEFKPYVVTTYPPTYVYSGPGEEYDCVMTLEEQGAYTIVEEFYNFDTNTTWGKLKSGAGWIELN